MQISYSIQTPSREYHSQAWTELKSAEYFPIWVKRDDSASLWGESWGSESGSYRLELFCSAWADFARLSKLSNGEWPSECVTVGLEID